MKKEEAMQIIKYIVKKFKKRLEFEEKKEKEFESLKHCEKTHGK